MPKVWLALFFGYNGQNFQGMQHQKQQSVNSIQKLLVNQLFKEGLLPTKNYGELQKNYKWGRAARTDKGVHAVINGISCLFTISQQFYDQDKCMKKDAVLVKLKQTFQNTQIIIHAFRKVTNRFDMRSFVKSRTYCYICPENYFVKAEATPQQKQKVLLKIKECCKQFIGTHNFHNYSKDLKAKDPKAKRYIMQFDCEYLQKNGKWLKFKIKGQSFVYHQIRKIIGSILQIFMSEYQPSFILNTFFNNQFYVPLAPPFGLYLRSLTFQSYNRKLQIPQKIQFENQETSLQKTQNIIIEHIAKTEQQKWDMWLNQVQEGVVPKFDQEGDQQIDDE